MSQYREYQGGNNYATLATSHLHLGGFVTAVIDGRECSSQLAEQCRTGMSAGTSRTGMLRTSRTRLPLKARRTDPKRLARARSLPRRQRPIRAGSGREARGVYGRFDHGLLGTTTRPVLFWEALH